MKTTGIQEQIMLSAGVTTIPDLNHGDFLSLPLVFPNMKEQKDIVTNIENIKQKNAIAILCKEKEIEKLKEYRATLINSAVTGKIKVS